MLERFLPGWLQPTIKKTRRNNELERHPDSPGATSAPGRAATDGALAQLTSLRYVAAFAVMGSHLEFLGASADAWLRLTYDRLLAQGYCGVSFFFVLSGFIISYAYRDDIAARRLSVPEFLRRRAVRIFPLHWLVALPFIAWVALVRGEPVDPLAAALNLLLLHSWALPVDLHFSFNGPSWSLSNELFFYAAFPLLILLRVRTLAIGTAVAVALVAVLASRSAGSSATYSSDVEWLFYVNPLVRLIEFAAGMLVFALYRSGRLQRLAGTPGEVLLLALLPVAMIAVDVLAVPLAWRYQLFFLPLMVALVFVFACGRGAVSRLLRAPALVALGEASFALYLIHRPIFTLAQQLAGTDLDAPAAVLLAITLLAGGTALSVQVHRRIDRPLQSWLRQRLQRVPRSSAPPAPSRKSETANHVA